MTLSLFAIVIGLAIVIAIPLARVIHYLEREMRFRQMMRPVHEAMARGQITPQRTSDAQTGVNK